MTKFINLIHSKNLKPCEKTFKLLCGVLLDHHSNAKSHILIKQNILKMIKSDFKFLYQIYMEMSPFIPHYFSDNNFSIIYQNKKPLKSALSIIIARKNCRKSS